MSKRLLLLTVAAAAIACTDTIAASGSPALQFQARTSAEAQVWQKSAREKLFASMMGGQRPDRTPLEPKVIRRVEVPGARYVLEELTLQTLPDRRVHVWVGRPVSPRGKTAVVLAINGHGGSGEQVVRGQGLYWYGRALLEMGCLVVAPDVGQHDLQHTNWSLMGERTWDALRSLDYALTLPEADSERVAVAGLSLGGETTMYVAALDERVKLACSSGWLTTVANMKNGHCACFNFPGLEENFDFSDIFSCVAPRGLICELGEQERAPGGFPVSIGGEAMQRIRTAYEVFGAAPKAQLTVHAGPHVFSGKDFFPQLRTLFRLPANPLPDDSRTAAWVRFTNGAESLDGTPYFWLGKSDFRVSFEVPPETGDALELAWGAKGDVRDAELAVNGAPLTVRDGGHWGFRWIRVPLPEKGKGTRYEVAFKRAQGQPAFLSEVRLVRAAPQAGKPALTKAAEKGSMVLLGQGEVAAEAFPAQRRAWDTETPVPPKLKGESARRIFQQSERNGRLAAEALFRCRKFVEGWLARADPETGLIPRNLRESGDFWNGRDSAADNYPFMVLTAAFIDPPLLESRMLQMLRTEERLTSRVGRLPDDYSFSRKGWRREEVNLDQIIFDGAEYVKDGLLPITEWMGPSPWSERMVRILDDIWANAKVETPFGSIPTLNAEVCGDLLQACSRVYWLTGDKKYFDWGARLGDYFLLGTNHPTRDARQLRLIDHGCEVVNGLSELYVAAAQVHPGKKRAWENPLHELFDCILQKGRNDDGLLYSWFNPQTGEHSPDLCDTWGYDLDGFYTMWLVDQTPAYRDAVRKALSNLKGKYVGACWGDKSADGFADSIEGALNLYNREPIQGAADWIDSQIRMMWAIQKPDGIIEGWHGDGNSARTSLMYTTWKTQGVTVDPWPAGLRVGSVREGKTLHTTLVSPAGAWNGIVKWDRRRHKAFMHLPMDYTRINQFPEWFTVEPGAKYELRLGGKRYRKTGEELAKGIAVSLRADEPLLIELRQ